MSHDTLERAIVEKFIESMTKPFNETKEINMELLKLVAKYRSRVGEDSWMQRQFNKGEPDHATNSL